MTTIIEVKDALEVTHGEAIVINWAAGFDYDTAINLIHEVMGSDLNGREQMALVRDIAQAFIDGD